MWHPDGTLMIVNSPSRIRLGAVAALTGTFFASGCAQNGAGANELDRRPVAGPTVTASPAEYAGGADAERFCVDPATDTRVDDGECERDDSDSRPYGWYYVPRGTGR